MDIEYLPHTADIRMKIQGSSLEELFLNAIRGMNDILKQGFCEPARNYSHSTLIETIDMAGVAKKVAKLKPVAVIKG
jgi:SHS2 domain-containing protein